MKLISKYKIDNQSHYVGFTVNRDVDSGIKAAFDQIARRYIFTEDGYYLLKLRQD